MSNLEMIQKLRQKTGAGMMNCKKALEDNGDDFDKAVEMLRKKGIAKAAKREDRETSEGIVKIETSEDGKTGYMVEINCETDFVSRNEQFQDFANKIFEIVKSNKVTNREDLMSADFEGITVESKLQELSGSIGEKFDVRNVAVLESSGTVAAYSHMGGKIGVLLAINKADKTDLAYEIAMQIAAMNPQYLKPEDVPQDIVEKEKEIYAEQLKKEGKPEEIMIKILEGKISKFYKEVCLLNQVFIKDDSKIVDAYLKSEAGDDAQIEKYIRFSLQ